jgi:hypothetical protein
MIASGLYSAILERLDHRDHMPIRSGDSRLRSTWITINVSDSAYVPHCSWQSRNVERCTRLFYGNPGHTSGHLTKPGVGQVERGKGERICSVPYPPCTDDPVSHPRVNVSAHPIPRVRVFHGIKAIATARASSIVQKVGVSGRRKIRRLAEVSRLIIFVTWRFRRLSTKGDENGDSLNGRVVEAQEAPGTWRGIRIHQRDDGWLDESPPSCDRDDDRGRTVQSDTRRTQWALKIVIY